LHLAFSELKESEDYLKIGRHITHYAGAISICKEIVTANQKYRLFALCLGRSISIDEGDEE
jgi:5-methylcytosine-specific restriction endonuclease McrBC regulatory subunit McrC